MQPNKNLGQHWLNHSPSLEAVVDVAEVSSNDFVIEIGPGLGSLTELLASRAKSVMAVEFDSQLATQLKQQVAADNLTVVEQDIRQFDFSDIETPYKVVGNIPYYLTSHLIQILLESGNPPENIGLLVQKEVAERVAAQPGELSILGVTAQLYAEVSLGPVVPAELFEPPPKVDSQVLGLKPNQNQIDYSQTIQVVKFGFSQRRKQLKNTLAAALQLDKQDIAKVLEECSIEAKIRPQSLTIDQWQMLTAALVSRGYV